MKADKKLIVKAFGVFAGLMVGFWLFLSLCAAIPNESLQKNMIKSALSYAKEEPFAFCDEDKLNGVADHYADSIWLNVAWYMGEGKPLMSSLNTRYYDGEEYGENIGLYMAVSDMQVSPNTDYTRYWHGTAGIIRMLHLFTDVIGIKQIGFTLAMLLAAGVMFLLMRDKNAVEAAAFFISLCAVKIWNIRLSMEYQPAFIVCFLMCILYLLLEKKKEEYMVVLSVAGGALIAFLDFLTVETIVFTVPLMLVIAVRNKQNRLKSLKETLVLIVTCAVAWLGAYLMTFVVKWGLASFLTGENKFALAMHSASIRAGNTIPARALDETMPLFMAAPLSNISVLFGSTNRLDMLCVCIGLLSVVLLGLLIALLKKNNKNSKTATICFLMLGSLIFLRYIVLSNHSYMHSFFTCRGLFAFIFSILLIGRNSVSPGNIN